MSEIKNILNNDRIEEISFKLVEESRDDKIEISAQEKIRLLEQKISELNSKIETFENQNDKYFNVFNFSHDAVAFTRISDGKIIEINEGFEKLFKFKKENVIGKTTLEIKLWNSKEDREKMVAAIRKSGEIKNFETVFITNSGEQIPSVVSSKIVLVKNEEQLLTVAHDLSYQKDTEYALKLSEQTLSGFIENLPMGIYRTTAKGEILKANKALVKMLGFNSFEEMLGRNIEERGYKDLSDRNKFKEIVSRFGEIIGFETVWLNAAGEEIFIRENARAVKNPDGDILYYEGTVEDITDKVNFLKKIKLLSQAVEQNPNPIAVTDTTGKVQYVNESFCKTTGYSFDELKGKNPSILKSGFTPAHVYKELWENLRNGKEWSGELLNKRKNGSLYWENSHIFPVRNDEGNVTSYLAFKEDITEKKEIEKKILLYNQSLEQIVKERTESLVKVKDRLEEEIQRRILDEQKIQDQLLFLRSLIDTVPNPIFVKDKNKVYTDCNTAFSNLLGINKSDIIGKTVYEISSDDFAKKYDLKDDELIEKKGIQSYEEKLFDKNGKEHSVIFFKTVFYNIEDKVDGLVGVILDISERIKFEKELLNTIQKEKELNDLKTKFISTASHEFRTPLTSILASADLLEMYGRNWKEEKYFEHTKKIQNAVERMTRLLSDVLTISRNDSKKLEFNPEIINLFDLCNSVIDENRANLKKDQKIKFQYEIEEKANADSQLLQLILSNLIGNAIKYSPENSDIVFSVNYNQEGLIEFKVKDNGIGISEEDQKNIFEAFRRGENVGSISGTGLGLSIVKHAVELHSGKITVSSKLNKGTTFTFTI